MLYNDDLCIGSEDKFSVSDVPGLIKDIFEAIPGFTIKTDKGVFDYGNQYTLYDTSETESEDRDYNEPNNKWYDNPLLVLGGIGAAIGIIVFVTKGK